MFRSFNANKTVIKSKSNVIFYSISNVLCCNTLYALQNLFVKIISNKPEVKMTLCVYCFLCIKIWEVLYDYRCFTQLYKRI